MRPPASPFYTRLVSQINGPLNLLTGVAIVSLPLINLLLFPLVRTIIYSALGLAGLLALNLLSMTGILPFRPMIPLDIEPSLYINTSNTLIAGLFVIYQLSIAALLINGWKLRESNITKLTVTDPLTGMANRRHILELLELELTGQRNAQQPFSLVMIDIDHFKHINDTHGHWVGDIALTQVAKAINNCIRLDDRLGRYGGEEFLILLPDAGPTQASQVAERCRNAVEQLTLAKAPALSITASFGVTSCLKQQVSHWDSLIRQADDALYCAKENGRNQVVAAGSFDN